MRSFPSQSDVGLRVSLIAFPALIVLIELYTLFVPSYSDEQLKASLVDTWQVHAFYAVFVFWILFAVFVLAIAICSFAKPSLRGAALVTAMLCLTAAALLALNDRRLTARAEAATGMQIVPTLNFLVPCCSSALTLHQ